MPRVINVLATSVVVMSLGACGLSLDGFTDGPVVIVNDGGIGNESGVPVNDGAVNGDGGGSSDAGLNLAPNGNFETSGPSENSFPCGPPWKTFESTLQRSTDSHGGASSCRVCYSPDVTGTGYTIDQGLTDQRPISAGIKLHAAAFVKAVIGATQSQQVAISLRVYQSGGGPELQNQPGAPVFLGVDWQPISVDLTTTSSGDLNVIVLAMDQQASDCFLVDDITVVQVE